MLESISNQHHICKTTKLQDKNGPNPYIKIHPFIQNDLPRRNTKFSKSREIPSEVMIQMNVANINIYSPTEFELAYGPTLAPNAKIMCK